MVYAVSSFEMLQLMLGLDTSKLITIFNVLHHRYTSMQSGFTSSSKITDVAHPQNIYSNNENKQILEVGRKGFCIIWPLSLFHFSEVKGLVGYIDLTIQ